MIVVDKCAGDCGATDFSPNVEAFEVLGVLVCDDCAEALLEADPETDLHDDEDDPGVDTAGFAEDPRRR